MVVFNLPEEQRIMPERQRIKDMEDITYLVSYIDETAADEEGLRLSENIIDVIRLGRKTEGKHRPLRVKFRGQLYCDTAVKRGFRVRYIAGDEVLK